MKIGTLLEEDKIKHFENEQKEFGTKIALYNYIWSLAYGIFKGIGVVHCSTEDYKDGDVYLKTIDE